MKHRKERVEHRLAQDIGLFLEAHAEDDLLLEARVVRVTCTNDLRHARVGLNHPRGRAIRDRLLDSARALREDIRAFIGDRVSGRFVPDVSFVFDDSEELLRKIDALTIPPPPPGDPDGTTDDEVRAEHSGDEA